MSAPASLSVVIPVLDPGRMVEPLLAALSAASLVGEIILVDGGSKAPFTPGKDFPRLKCMTAPRGRGQQLRAGGAAAGGSWLLFLHADSCLDDEWEAAIACHMRDSPERAGYFWLRYQGESRAGAIVARWANGRSRLLALPYGDQGLLISRRLYARVGGFEPITLMEDVALVRKIGRKRLRPLGCPVFTSPVRASAEGWMKRSLRNALCLGLYFLGVPPSRIVRLYNG